MGDGNVAEWDSVALFHDLLYGDKKDDLPFWIELTRLYGSPVLEFASGTSRITLALAKAGIDVTGIDISEGMLKIARDKISEHSQEVQKHINIIKADVCNFEIPKAKFPLIISPWGFHPVTEEQISNCFQSAKKHLTSNGRFVIDSRVYKEKHGDWEKLFLDEYKEFPEKGFVITRTTNTKGSSDTMISHNIFFFDQIFSDGTIKRFVSQRDDKLYTKESMEKYITGNGFKIEKIYGNYKFKGYELGDPRMIFVLTI